MESVRYWKGPCITIILMLLSSMTQDERWTVRYDEVKNFILNNMRNPSKYADDERLLIHFLKRGRKLMNAGELKEPRLSMFQELLKLSERYRHINQWK